MSDDKEDDVPKPAGPPTDGGVANATGTPPWLTISCAVSGFLMIVISAIIFLLLREALVWQLGFCTGIALVLAAFGTRADAQWRGFVVTGAGAIALAMFWALQYFAEKPPVVTEKPARVIFYSEYPTLVELVSLESAGTPLPGAWVKVRSNYFFRVLETDFKDDDCLSFVVAADFNNNGEIDDEEEYTAELHRRHLQAAFDTKKPARFWFDHNSRAVYKSKASFDKDESPIGSEVCSEAQFETTSVNFTNELYKALALLNPVSQAKAANADEIDGYIQDLSAKSSSVRRAARNALGAIGSPAIPALAAAYQANNSSYRVTLGVVYSLNQMLKNGSSNQAQMRRSIPSSTLKSMSLLIDDPDKTMRGRAISFMVELADERLLDSFLSIVASPNSAEGEYNAALAIAEIWKNLDASSKTKAERNLRAVSTNLNSESISTLSEIFATNETISSTPTGWAFVGVYNGKTWVQDNNLFNVSGIPQPGDILTAETKVNIRTGPIQFDKKLGWVNQTAVGVIQKDQKIEVIDVENINDGSIWVRFSAASNSTANNQSFYIVVGSFSTANIAKNAASKLAGNGFDIQMFESTSGFYNLTIGRENRQTAESILNKALSAGLIASDSYLYDGSRFEKEIRF